MSILIVCFGDAGIARAKTGMKRASRAQSQFQQSHQFGSNNSSSSSSSPLIVAESMLANSDNETVGSESESFNRLEIPPHVCVSPGNLLLWVPVDRAVQVCAHCCRSISTYAHLCD